MLPGDRLICTFVESQAIGTQFKTWLLHVTVVPWFRLDVDADVLGRGLEKAMYEIAPFDIATGEIAMFGPRKNRQVRLLLPTEQLERIETKTRIYLHKKHAFLLDETTQKPYSFRPHVTAQNGFLLPEATSFHIDRLYIVQQKGNYKEIVNDIKLHG